MARSTNPEHNPYRPNGWKVLSDVFIALINKGQLVMFLLCVILIIAVSKMSQSDVKELFAQTIELLHTYHIYGWVATVVLTPTFVLIYGRTLKLHHKEIESLMRDFNKHSH